MGLILLTLFIAVPIIEFALFIEIGGFLGLWPTLLIVVLTALLGTILLRAQGLATIRRAEQHMAAGELPVNEVVSGLFLLVAGSLLLTPGFMTDAIGFSLFVPSVRLWLGQKILAYLMARGTVHIAGFGDFENFRGPGEPRSPNHPSYGPTIDGDFTEVKPGPSQDDSPWSQSNGSPRLK